MQRLFAEVRRHACASLRHGGTRQGAADQTVGSTSEQSEGPKGYSGLRVALGVAHQCRDRYRLGHRPVGPCMW